MNPAVPVLALVVLALAAALAWWFVAAAFLLWGARLAGVERRSFGRALATILLGGLAWAAVQALFFSAPLVGTGAGLLLGFCVSAAVMTPIFDTSFGKAFAANVLAWVLPFLLAGALFLLGIALLGGLMLLA
ncbi:MAG: hypothetical protein EOL90_09585 [Spartobacteria bacterium]|nr:hypothetical protein [Spartobacteria bacterium]